MNDFSRIGMNIKEYRQAAGMSQQELSEKVGFAHRSSINKIERGDREIRVRTLFALSNVFKCEVTDLLQGVSGGINAKSSEVQQTG